MMHLLKEDPRVVRELSRGLYLNRHLQLAIAWCSALACALAAYINTLATVPSSGDGLLVIALGLVQFLVGAAIFSLHRRHMYRVLIIWIVLTLAFLVALIGRAMLGDPASRIWPAAQPYVSAYLPLGVLLAFSFLAERHASLITLLFGLGLCAVTASYLLLNPAETIDWSIVLLQLLDVSFGLAIIAVLVRIHLRLQAGETQLQEARNQSLREENLRLRNLQQGDIRREGADAYGIQVALQRLIDAGQPVFLSLTYIRGLKEMQSRLAPGDTRRLIGHLRASLSRVYGESTQWGTTDDQLVVMWSSSISQSAARAARRSMEQRYHYLEFNGHSAHLFFGHSDYMPGSTMTGTALLEKSKADLDRKLAHS